MSKPIANEVYVAFKASTIPIVGEEPNDWVTTIRGKLKLRGRNGKIIHVGEFILHIIEPQAYGDDQAPSNYNLLDVHSWVLSEFYSVLFGEDATDDLNEDEFSQEIAEILHLPGCRRFLVLESIEIEPVFRGQRIGLIAIARMIRLLAEDCDLVATKAVPLYPLRPDLNFEIATHKLMKYWQGLGFQPVPNHHPYMVMSAITNLPSTPAILGWDS